MTYRAKCAGKVPKGRIPWWKHGQIMVTEMWHLGPYVGDETYEIRVDERPFSLPKPKPPQAE